jgi:dihydrolipoamide dehydrogenase
MLFHKYVVIGSGKTGLDASLMLAQRGLDVLLIEVNDLGGSYLFSHDLPKEFLSKQSNVINSFRKRLPRDIKKSLSIDLEKIITTKIKNRYEKIRKQCSRFPNLSQIKGKATFGSKNVIEIEVKDGDKVLIAFENALICSGLSKMEIPQIKGLKNISFLYQHNAFYGENIPLNLALIGCTKDTMEVADIFSSLGTKVSVFEEKSPEKVLNNQDTTAINYMFQNLLKKGVEFFFNAEIMEITKENNSEIVLLDHEGNKYNFNEVYVQVKEFFRNEMTLENADLKYSNHGIYTSGNGQTNQKNIYAFGACSNSFGNVTAKSQLLHYVERQSIGNFEQGANKNRMLIVTNNQQKYNDIATIDFRLEKINLEKSISTIGLTYREAIDRVGTYAKFMILINDDLDGFVKLVYNDQTNQVFGISLTGEACDKNYHFALDAVHKCYNIQEIRSILLCLGFHT